MRTRPLRLTAELLARLRAEQPFELRIHDVPEHALSVHSFQASEKLSGAFRFDIQVTTSLEEDLEELVLARPARFLMRLGGVTRAVHGLVTRAKLVCLHPHLGRAQYDLRLEPRLSLLRYRHGSRIFQDQSVVEVVTHVLREAHVQPNWVLNGTYPKRPYLTQYEESDWDFVRRLLAEAGVFFGFEQRGMAPSSDDSLEHIFVGDDPAAYVSVDRIEGMGVASLPYLGGEDGMTAGGSGVLSFELARTVGIHRATYREADPDRPGALLEHSARIGDHAGEHVPEHTNLELEHYLHHGETWYPNWDAARDEPRRILRQRRRRCALAKGTGTSLALIPGHRFRLIDHPVARLNDELVVTKIDHAGWAVTDEEQPRLYSNAFECVPARITYSAKRKDRRRALVALTGTVVGPGKDDIHVDAQGRIKVRFHWDRRPAGKGEESCWLRTMQAWSGGSFGTQFIPRVGMEVVVSFEGGDPDKPLVLGCVYNGSAPLPFSPVTDKTRSGIRTKSSPAASGHNELSFEDQVAKEQIYLHAQRDFDEKVRRNHSLEVGGAEQISVLGKRVDYVHGDVEQTHGQTSACHVKGDHEMAVDGNHRSTVKGHSESRVAGHLATYAEGRELRHTCGEATLEYLKNLGVKVHGSETRLIGRHEAEASHTIHVEGVSTLHGTKRLTLSTDNELVLSCGTSAIRIRPAQIDLTAPLVTIRGKTAAVTVGEEEIALRSEEVALRLGAQGMVVACEQGASMQLLREAKIDGQRILLNSPTRANDASLRDDKKPTKIHLSDQHGCPIPGARFVVCHNDGRQVAGLLDERGEASLVLDSPATIVFPDFPTASSRV